MCAPPMKLALAAATTAAVLPVALRKARRVVFRFPLMLIKAIIPLSLLRSASREDRLPAVPIRTPLVGSRYVARLDCSAMPVGGTELKVHANRGNSKFLSSSSLLQEEGGSV